jgi:hypothetical protein
LGDNVILSRGAKRVSGQAKNASLKIDSAKVELVNQLAIYIIGIPFSQDLTCR